MSPIRTGPYLNFQGRAREAMEFYHEVLGGTLDLLAVDGQARRRRPADRVRHARLEAGGGERTGPGSAESSTGWVRVATS